ncbi:Prefoldin [Crucibulum laeve]|uniref:Prefoldin n=1 Tax=Crucibulum laeve TaxID=68775 RepID=A0A5C3LY84_9AGAR|nr:Prefoldin [Crucibulum laeve]
MSLAIKLQQASAEFQKLQGDLSKAVEARQRLDAQLSENELVKKEFAQLTPENTVFKQIGPVLVKQDQAEAKSNVETRLDFIRGEIKRVESQIKDIESKQEKKKQELVDIQTALQQQAQQNAAPSKQSSTTTPA